jgi:hypothetical protein
VGSEIVTEPEAAPEEIGPEALTSPVNPESIKQRIFQKIGRSNLRGSSFLSANRDFSWSWMSGADVQETEPDLPREMTPAQTVLDSDTGSQLADQLVRVHNMMSARTYLNMLNSLDDVKEELTGDIAFNKTILGSAIAVSTGLSVGYVVWLVRGGMLLSTLLTSIPAWQILDPLPILARRKDDDDGDGDESLASILDAKPKKRDQPESTGTASSGAEPELEIES